MSLFELFRKAFRQYSGRGHYEQAKPEQNEPAQDHLGCEPQTEDQTNSPESGIKSQTQAELPTAEQPRVFRKTLKVKGLRPKSLRLKGVGLQNLSLKNMNFRNLKLKSLRLKLFNPVSPSEIRRLQFFWAACILIVIFCVAYGLMLSLSRKETFQEESKRLEPKRMETASSKVNLNEGYWHKVEQENKKLHEDINALKTMFQEMSKAQAAFISGDYPGGRQDSLSETPLRGGPLNEETVSGSAPLEGGQPIEWAPTRMEELELKLDGIQAQLDAQKNNPSSQRDLSTSSASERERGGSTAGQKHETLIAKFSLGLDSSHQQQNRKTVDTTIPAGAFAQTILLSGLDASSAMNASSDPRPMLLRLIDHGTLPRRFQSDLKDCHCTASAYGDLSSERVYARLEKLTCIERSTGDIIETQVAGYIAGADGKAGIRGVVASKDGEFLSRSLIGGVFAGLSNVANPQSRQGQANPFFGANGMPGAGSQGAPLSVGGMFASGMATGATTALDRLSQYYIDRAEQLQPVIQIAAGQVVDIVFTEGTSIGSQNIKSDIEKTRNDARGSSGTSISQSSSSSPSSHHTGD